MRVRGLGQGRRDGGGCPEGLYRRSSPDIFTFRPVQWWDGSRECVRVGGDSFPFRKGSGSFGFYWASVGSDGETGETGVTRGTRRSLCGL